MTDQERQASYARRDEMRAEDHVTLGAIRWWLGWVGTAGVVLIVSAIWFASAQVGRIDALARGQAKIVHVLRAAHGRVVTTSQLSAVVCRDPLNPPYSRNVAVLICHLRKRRPDIGAQIENARGLGYRWRR